MYSLATVLTLSTGAFAERDAIVTVDSRLTYRQVNGEADRFANLLASKGLRPGDKVALPISA